MLVWRGEVCTGLVVWETFLVVGCWGIEVCWDTLFPVDDCWETVVCRVFFVWRVTTGCWGIVFCWTGVDCFTVVEELALLRVVIFVVVVGGGGGGGGGGGAIDERKEYFFVGVEGGFVGVDCFFCVVLVFLPFDWVVVSTRFEFTFAFSFSLFTLLEEGNTTFGKKKEEEENKLAESESESSEFSFGLATSSFLTLSTEAK